MSALLVKLLGLLLNNLQEKLAALIVTAITGSINFLNRNQIGWGVSHGFTFNVPQQTGPLKQFHTGTIFIQNVGRRSASNIEVHFNYKPEHMQIWPSFNYKPANTPDGQYCIYIDNLGKREWLQIEMLSTFTLPEVLRVRTGDGECKKVDLAPTQVLSPRLRRFVSLLILLGIFFSIYHLILLAQFLINQ